jgi:predicted O-methyltransferase YrrM
VEPADRPSITEAARRWVATGELGTGLNGQLRQAIGDFVANRYFGFAPRLRALHEYRRSLYGEERSIDDVVGLTPSGDASLDVIARTATNPEKGRLLFHLARNLAPCDALELGTSIGISAGYIALGLEAGGGGRLVTVDASEARTSLASRAWSVAGVSGIEQVVGRFDDVLEDVLGHLPDLKFAYVDGNHRKQPTLDYLGAIEKRMSTGLVVFDDIRWSEEMLEAWSEIMVSHPSSVDLGWIGLVLIER